MRRSTVDSTTDRAVGFENSAYLFIDSNILYPIRLADLVLSSVDDGLFEVEDLLNEIERVLIDTKGLAVDKAKAFTRDVASNAAHVAPNSSPKFPKGLPTRCR